MHSRGHFKRWEGALYRYSPTGSIMAGLKGEARRQSELAANDRSGFGAAQSAGFFEMIPSKSIPLVAI